MVLTCTLAESERGCAVVGGRAEIRDSHFNGNRVAGIAVFTRASITRNFFENHGGAGVFVGKNAKATFNGNTHANNREDITRET